MVQAEAFKIFILTQHSKLSTIVSKNYNDFHTIILLHLNGILFWTKHQMVKPEVVGVIGHENTINIYEDKLDVNPRMLSDAGRDTAQENGGI